MIWDVSEVRWLEKEGTRDWFDYAKDKSDWNATLEISEMKRAAILDMASIIKVFSEFKPFQNEVDQLRQAADLWV